MRIPCYHVDAFTSQVFGGNPAAVCPLDTWLPDNLLQSIAAENNLSETAFYRVRPDGEYDLRWFTPEVEVDLCGHATLATAHVILETRKERKAPTVAFHSKSGRLQVDRSGDRYVLDFPARPPQECPPNSAIAEALGKTPNTILAARDYLCVYDSAQDIANLTPDMAAVAKLDRFAVIVTAPGTDCDFVSRFFAPSKGIPEDPVTGSAHCTLIPYWAKRLGKTSLFARQISRRGGELWCELAGERVKIAGHAASFCSGSIELP